jgi:predicted DNA-binding transcriptional regulator AlpA
VPAFLGVSRTAFYRLKSQAGFPRPVTLPGAELSYRRADLEAWVARLRAARPKRRGDERGD